MHLRHGIVKVMCFAAAIASAISAWIVIVICMTNRIEAGESLPPLKVKPDAPRLEEAIGKIEELPKVNAPCYVCHLNYADEELSLKHAGANVGCMTCHGKSEPHRGDEFNRTPPDVMFPRDAIIRFCEGCHKTHNASPHLVIQRWLERCFGEELKRTVCTDCHGEHRLKRRRVVWDRQTGKLLHPADAEVKVKEGRDVGIKALIVTGVDHPAHNWRETTPTLVRLLEADKRIVVRVVEDPYMLDSHALHRYDVVIIHFMNWDEPSPGLLARQNIKRFVGQGKGLVLIHFACGAWRDWDEFIELAGRVWDPKLRPHDPRGKFTVEIVNKDHPITIGMQSFETDDELYTCLSGDRKIEVLAEARSKVDGLKYPIAFVLNYGAGRVFQCTLGHDVKALSVPQVGELLRRGVLWASGRFF